MTGGVSSDIQLIETAQHRFCVKRALARLKVAALWEVPVGRNAAEAAWMRRVGEWLPGTAPEVLGEDRSAGLFAMAYLPPEDHPVWKSELMAGRVDAAFAAQVGDRLAAIHARSAACPGIASAFANHATFDDIRIDPYLRATGRAHPDLLIPFRSSGQPHAGHPDGPDARRREPEEHPGRTGRSGIPRCRMRLLR